MKALVFLTIACIVSVSGVGIAQQEQQSMPPAAAAHYSRTELKTMIRTAHTPEQYQSLSSYFRQRQGVFQQQADETKQEWDRRSQNVTGPAAKFPRPVDSARNLYGYYSSEANRMSVLAARYEEQLAQSTQPPVNR